MDAILISAMDYSSSREIRWWYDGVRDETEIRQFASREWAHRWLLGFRGDLFRMSEFRRLLSSANYRALDRRDDSEVLRVLSSEIGSGRFVIVRRKPVLVSGGGADANVAPPNVDAPPPPAPRTPTPDPAGDEPTFGTAADPVAIAEAMQEAALLGLPFCEECARKALAAGTRA